MKVHVGWEERRKRDKGTCRVGGREEGRDGGSEGEEEGWEGWKGGYEGEHSDQNSQLHCIPSVSMTRAGYRKVHEQYTCQAGS